MIPRARERDWKAIDAADETIRCKCGRPECVVARIQPFREHISELYRTIAACHWQRILTPEWEAVLYPLQMAASIHDVQADTGYVDDTMAYAHCESVSEYENAHSIVASEYVAALSIFTFVWTAYEAAVMATEPNAFSGEAARGENGKRGRLLTEIHSNLFDEFEGISNFANAADAHCNVGGLFDERLEKVRTRYPVKDFVFAAELVREFRNHLFHGEDQAPEPEQWSEPRETRCRIYRFYDVARLALFLIQLMACIGVETEPDVAFKHDPETDEELYEKPRVVFARLHLRSGIEDV